MPDIERDIQSGVLWIILNRPEKSNAFTIDMVDQWARWLREAREDPDVRSIVLAARGKNFCAGADFNVLGDTPSPINRKRRLTDHIHRVAYALEDLDKPVVAAINGAATGAGLDMALMCDIRFAGESARLSESYVRVGLVPGDGGGYFLPRIVGLPKALELLLGGEFIDAHEAHRIGLVNRIFPDSDLWSQTQDFAKKLADLPPINVRMIKRTVYQSIRSDLRTSLDLVSSHMAVVQTTQDSREALTAFRESRSPSFVGD